MYLIRDKDTKRSLPASFFSAGVSIGLPGRLKTLCVIEDKEKAQDIVDLGNRDNGFNLEIVELMEVQK